MDDLYNYVSRVKAVLTNDSELSQENPQWYFPAELEAHLVVDPRHAVTIFDLEEGSGECVAVRPQYVLRGASEALNNFYFGALPAEDPNDADGGDLSAREALLAALDQLCLA